MKYIIILALTVACASQNKQQTSTPIPETPPTESEAKQVSPHEIEPCFCMKIYQPVCAKGQTFGNSCEAKCQGNNTWTEGPCGKTPKK